MDSTPSSGTNFRWLTRLRWCAIGGQIVTLVFVQVLYGAALPLPQLATLVGIEIVTNAACEIWPRRRGPIDDQHWLATLHALDVLILTAILFCTGGAENPFSFVYLIYIAVAAVMLSARWTWALVALALACSALLFVDHRPLPVIGRTHAETMAIHFRGMWVAFGISASLIVYFLLRLLRALAARETELRAARQRAERQERLGSLATLAAGAAHELATPLSTIAVVARELERQLADAGEATVRADVLLIRAEVERCRRILDRMSADAGATTGEAVVAIDLGRLVDDSLAEVTGAPIELAIDEAARRASVAVPPRAVALVLRNLIQNARDAAPDASIRVAALFADGVAHIEVRDRGSGMSPEVAARAGEPFFTTKPPGAGMGLGLFLSRTVLERIGGELRLESAVGRGTTATITLPRSA